MCYAKGYLGVTQDYEESEKWCRKAAGQNDAKGQYLLGICYEKGWGVTQSYDEAVNWYRKAAEQNFAEAQGMLGASYYSGQGVAKDEVEAYKWMVLAAAQGYTGAKEGIATLDGALSSAQIAEAKLRADEWRKQHNSTPKAGSLFGDVSEAPVAGPPAIASQGATAPQDATAPKDAAASDRTDWSEASLTDVRKAAARGNVSAQAHLGVCYLKGQGVQKDVDEGIKWVRKAAEQGNARAQNRLGWCYEYGRGVESNYDEANKWYKLAAKPIPASEIDRDVVEMVLQQGNLSTIKFLALWADTERLFDEACLFHGRVEIPGRVEKLLGEAGRATGPDTHSQILIIPFDAAEHDFVFGFVRKALGRKLVTLLVDDEKHSTGYSGCFLLKLPRGLKDYNQYKANTNAGKERLVRAEILAYAPDEATLRKALLK